MMFFSDKTVNDFTRDLFFRSESDRVSMADPSKVKENSMFQKKKKKKLCAQKQTEQQNNFKKNKKNKKKQRKRRMK